MGKRFVGVLATGVISALALSACGSSSTGSTTSSSAATTAAAAATTSSAAAASDTASASATAGTSTGGKVGVILPDSASSARWETADRKFLEDAFKAAGVGYDIQNAGGDKAKFQTIADGMIGAGVKVLMIVNLDSDTGAAVIKKATAASIPVIDYDRLTLGGGAKYYVSFDNVAVGTAIGTGLVKGLQAAGKKTGSVLELNGSPTDNNATLFKQGYDAAVKAAGYTVGDSQAVPDWDNTKAVTVFEQMFNKAGGKVDGVAAANDGLGGAAISILKKNGLAGKVPVTGQDATDEGLQRVLLGSQYVTVYKAVKKEADAASALAIALIKGDTAAATALATKTTDDSKAGTKVPSVLLDPQPIYADTVKAVVTDGFTTAAKLCTTAELKTACTKYGVS